MDLTQENTFRIDNKIYCLGNPVVSAETLQQLVYAMSVSGDTQRPIVIINPNANSVPNFQELLENFLFNKVTTANSETKTTYVLQNATDADIRELAEQQYRMNNSLSVAYLVRMYTVIRQQSKIKQAIDNLKSESEALWREHCANPNSDAGSARYAEIQYQELPNLQAELTRVTEELAFISNHSQSDEFTPMEEPVAATLEQPQESSSDSSSTVPEPVIEESNLPISAANIKSATVCLKWLDSKNLLMPLSAAIELSESSGYQSIKNQQANPVGDYQPVPLPYLLMLGIPVFPDGVPIVFTQSGEFMRIGTSPVSCLNQKYWFPKPSFEL